MILLFISTLSVFCFYINNLTLTVDSGVSSNQIVEAYSTGAIEDTTSNLLDDEVFKLKTLIITGDFDSSNYENATKSEYCTILTFNTIEETKQHYYELIKNPNINVMIDEVADISISQVSFPPYSGITEDWGYQQTSMNTYNSYLKNYNISDEEVVVVVIDSGINTSHNLLKNRILRDTQGNYVGRASTNGGSKVTTGYTYSGYEFEDDNGHGTHVAGIIANSTPTNVKILPIKFIPKSGKFSISTQDIINLFSSIGEYAKTYNIVAVNMSWGGYDWPSSLQTYLTNYIDNNLIVNQIVPIAAAGNEQKSANTHFPSSLNSVVCVSALKKTTSSATFDSTYSNYGSSIDISAPGTNITSCYISSTNSANATITKSMKGTSMATPYVSAAVALLCLNPNYNGDLTVSYLTEQLYDLAIDKGDAGKDIYYGYGMLSLSSILGNISYTVQDKTTTYNASYHNISVSVSGVANYTITYGLTSSDYSLTESQVLTNSAFKNYTNGEKKIFFKITATNYRDTFGFGFLTINKAQIGLTLQNQTATYGNSISLNQSKYTKTSGTIYSGDNLNISLSTSATSSSPVGTYDINASTTNDNYELNYSPGSLSITARPIHLSLSTQESEYLDGITLDHSKYIVTTGEIVNGDSLNIALSTTATSSSNVGNYAITISSYNNSNYSITYTRGIYKITQKTVDVSCSTLYGYYGNIPDLSDISISTSPSIDTQNIIATTEATSNSDANQSYHITFSFVQSCPESLNYKINESSYGLYTIERRPVTLKPTNQTITYGNEINLSNTYSVISAMQFVNNEDKLVTFRATTTATSSSSVGNYSIYLNYTDSANALKNYSISTNSSILTIEKRDLTIKATEQNKTFIYGNKIELDQTSFEIENVVNGDESKIDVSLSTLANKKSNVGSYEIVASFTENSTTNNYNISTQNGTFEISKRPISIKIANKSVIYSQTIDATSTYSVTSTNKIVNNDDLNLVFSTDATSTSDAGDYSLTATANNDNYSVNVTAGVLTIEKATVSLSISNQTSVYGDIVALDNSMFTVLTQNIDKDSLLITLHTTATNVSSANSNFDITATTGNPNYILSCSNGTLLITKRPISITVGNQTCTYGYISINQNNYELGQTVNGDIVDIVLSTSADNSSPVGTYSITATTDNDNYELNQTSGTLTIEEKEITITLNNQNGGYYGNIELSQTAYSLSDSVNDGELNIELFTTATNESNVGNSYEIYFTYDNTNYIITGEKAQFTVNPRPIIIEIHQTSIYGEMPVLDNDNFTVTSSIKMISGDNLNLTLATSATNTSPVGTYQIIATPNNSNYSVEITSQILEITKRNLTIHATTQNTEFIYGNEITLDQTKYEIINAINNDENKINVTLSTTASNSSPVGTHSIVVSYTENEFTKNYNITTTPCSFEIKKRPIQITISNQESSYGAQITLLPLYEITSALNVVNGDNLGVKLTTDADETSPIGDYSISLTFTNNNYAIEIIEGTLTIKQCDIIVTISPQSAIYGNDIILDQNAFEINSLIDKSTLGITLSTTATKGNGVGSNYEISATYTNTNYSLLIRKSYLEIEQRPISLTIQNQTCIYGNINLNQSKYSTSEHPIAEDFGIVLSTNATNQSNVGNSYEINFDYSNENYLITLTNSPNLEIKPRPISLSIMQTSEYGNNVCLNNNDFLVTSENKIVNDDNLGLTLSCSANNKSKVGQYQINMRASNSNYSVTLEKGELQITKRPISISIKQSSIYGNQINLNPNEYDIINGSLVNGDDLNLVLSTEALQTSVPNDYSIIIGDNNENYDLNLIEGTLTILKRPITILSIQTIQYGNPISLDSNQFTITEGSLVENNKELNLSFNTTANQFDSINNYPLSFAYSNSCYAITLNPNSKLTIIPRNLTIKLNNSTSVYGEEIVLDENYSIISGSIVSGDDLGIAFKTDATKTSDVGDYSINATKTNANYNLTCQNAVHTITKRPITVKLLNQKSNRGIMFEIEQDAYEIIEGSVADGTNLEIVITSKAKRLSNIGNYKLTATSNNSNYDVTIIDANLKLMISIDDIASISIVLIAGVVIAIKLKQHKSKKNKEQKIFNKYKDLL